VIVPPRQLERRCHLRQGLAKAREFKDVRPGTRQALTCGMAAAAASAGAAPPVLARKQARGRALRRGGSAPVQWRTNPPARKRDVENVARSRALSSVSEVEQERGENRVVLENYGRHGIFSRVAVWIRCHARDNQPAGHSRVRVKRDRRPKIADPDFLLSQTRVIFIKGVALRVYMDFHDGRLMRSIEAPRGLKGMRSIMRLQADAWVVFFGEYRTRRPLQGMPARMKTTISWPPSRKNI